MANHAQQLLTRVEVERLCKISKSTLFRLVRAGKFPAPIAIGPRARRWRAAELEAWLSGRPYSHGGDKPIPAVMNAEQPSSD